MNVELSSLRGWIAQQETHLRGLIGDEPWTNERIAGALDVLTALTQALNDGEKSNNISGQEEEKEGKAAGS